MQGGVFKIAGPERAKEKAASDPLDPDNTHASAFGYGRATCVAADYGGGKGAVSGRTGPGWAHGALGVIYGSHDISLYPDISRNQA